MEIQESARHIFGHKDEPPGMEGKRDVLANRDIYSLAMDSLSDWVGGRNVALAYFNFRHRRRGAFMGEYAGLRT